MPEKRSAQRVPVRLTACYRSQAATIEGLVTDLSRGGMFLSSAFLDAPGTSGVIEVALPGQGPPLCLRGEVVRVASKPEPGMGIRFHDLPDEIRRPLANFMMEASYQALA